MSIHGTTGVLGFARLREGVLVLILGGGWTGPVKRRAGLLYHSKDGGLVTWKLEAGFDLILHVIRTVLESLIIVLFEDCGVVLVRHLATVKQHIKKRLQLIPGITRVVDMSG